MAQSGWKAVLPIALLLVVAGPIQAQITTYYLHREASTVNNSNMQLKSAGPDASSLTLQTAELRNQPAGEYVIKSFETQANVPNIAGVIWLTSTTRVTCRCPRISSRTFAPTNINKRLSHGGEA
jgi:hypothetical protein